MAHDPRQVSGPQTEPELPRLRPGGGGADRAQRREERREALVDATQRAIRRHGAGVSMELIAEEAGITKPILYRHFGDKAGLAGVVAARFGAELFAALARVDAAQPDLDPRGQLEHKLRAGLGLVASDPAIFEFLVREGGGAPGANEGLERRMANLQLARWLEPVLRDLLAERELPVEAAEVWAYAMAGGVAAISVWWTHGRERMPIERVVGFLCDLLWDGLGGHFA